MSQQPVYYYGGAPTYTSPRAFYTTAAPAAAPAPAPAATAAQPTAIPQAAPRFFNGLFNGLSNFTFGDSAPATTAAPAAVQYQGAYPTAYTGGYYGAQPVPQYQVPQYQVPQYQVPQYQVPAQPQYQVPQYQVPAQPAQPAQQPAQAVHVNPILRPGVAAGVAAVQAGQGVGAAVQAGVAASQQVVESKHTGGRRKGLLFGVNYPGTDAELRGCVNDVFAIKEALIKYFGFAEKDLEILIDTDPKYQKPTGKNMLAAMKRLAADAKPGDILFMHYSGHGSQVPTRDPGELDGLDEVLVPCDFDVISDNALKECFSTVPSGVNFTFIADCCHSGTMLDHSEIILEGDKGKDTRTGASARSFVLPNAGSFAPSAQGAPRSISTETVVKKYLETAEKTRGKTRFSNLAPRPPNAAPTQQFSDVGILVTGCQSHQTSMDAYSKERRMMHGALTNALLKTWAKDPKLSYRKLVLAVRRSLFEDRYEQNPSLECNVKDADRVFLAPY